jgi:hypothetical protein
MRRAADCGKYGLHGNLPDVELRCFYYMGLAGKIEQAKDGQKPYAYSAESEKIPSTPLIYAKICGIL